MQILPNYPLQRLNTLGLSAQARFFCRPQTVDEVVDALAFAAAQQLPVLPLGQGSNVVIMEDFDGLAMHLDFDDIEVLREDEQFVYLRAGAGVEWQRLVDYCMQFHYWGLENLTDIPGTVGAAPIQNIGAYGVELCDVFYELQALECQSRLPVTFDLDACQFGYRDSIFKQSLKQRYLILSVTLKLSLEPACTIQYPALQSRFADAEVAPAAVYQAVRELRASKLPNPTELPNAGSFFQNPLVTPEHYQNLQHQYPQIVGYAHGEQVKLAAGWLIEQAGWKGRRLGAVGMYDKQALVLVNHDQACGRDVLALAQAIQADVQRLFDVSLAIEPLQVGARGILSETLD